MKLAGVKKLVRLPSADSTQAAARRLAEAGAPDGTLVWALKQTAGRGRLGRTWKSGPGGLYVTLLLRPAFAPERLADLSLACGAALAAALARFGVDTAVKPPNDVMAYDAKGRWKKLCGVLCEASGDSTSLHWLLIGVGVNVDNDPPLARAASLRSLRGRDTGLEPVLRAVMLELSRRLKKEGLR